jgi:hypothetical protein
MAWFCLIALSFNHPSPHFFCEKKPPSNFFGIIVCCVSSRKLVKYCLNNKTFYNAVIANQTGFKIRLFEGINSDTQLILFCNIFFVAFKSPQTHFLPNTNFVYSMACEWQHYVIKCLLFNLFN